MKFQFYVLSIALFTVLSTHAQSIKRVDNFGDNPGNLQMYIHAPESIARSQKTALVVAIHGCYQTAKDIAEQSGWNGLSDGHGFVVLYPQQKMINNGANCFNWFTEKDNSKFGGEVESIINMINYLKLEYQIDTSSTYLYGLSSGAATAINLMTYYPNHFSAGAVFAGGPFASPTSAMSAFDNMRFPDDLSPFERGSEVLIKNPDSTNYPRIIVGHGTHDNVVNYKNSLEIIDQWAYVHNLSLDSAHVDSSFANNSNVVRTLYGNPYKPKITFYQFIGGSHELPIDPGNGKKQGGSIGAFVKDRDFFSTYYVARDFGLIQGSED